MAKIIHGLFGLMIIAVVAAVSFAQETGGGDSVFHPIKNVMSDTIQENIRLAEENQALRARLVKLQMEVEGLEKEVRAIEPAFDTGRRFVREQGGVKPLQASGSEILDEDDLILEAQEIYLSGQSLNLGLVQQLRELELYDLQYEFQELRLDYRELEQIAGDVGDQYQKALQEIQDRIDLIGQKESYLERSKAQAQKALLSYPQEISLLEMEIKGLKMEVQQLRTSLAQ